MQRKPRTFVQVGAYLGDDRLIEHCRRSGDRLYMFEPNPKRVEDLRRKIAGAAGIEVIAKAVSNYHGKAVFHIACHDDCSSLQGFDANANTAWVHPWHPYKRFEMVGDLEVDVVRLDDFMNERGIEVTDRLEIDAQGEDLRVVQSLGNRFRDVKKIQIEVNIHAAPLYQNSFTLAEAIDFFGKHGFERHISWKQSMNREENITFRNRRFYPYPLVNYAVASAEQSWISARIAWVKLPRVIAVTSMMLRQKISGTRAI